MEGERFGKVEFQAHVELLQLFLAHRREIVERIQGLLNAQRKPAQYLQDRPMLSRHLEDCFFTLPAVTDRQSRLRGQLKEAHWAGGFRPRRVPGLYNDLADPAEMMIRGFHCWRQTRWPGRNGRVRYAQTLFDSYILRCLERMSLRIWDAGPGSAGDWLAQAQALLDELSRSAPSDQPALVRDARWLIPLAQSPTTDELSAYFEVAEQVSKSLPEQDRIEVQKAGVQMIGGHLRSQIRHYCLKDGLSPDEPSVVRRTRTSNALDFALLVQGLVPLLEAYERALPGGGERRLEFVSAICQGISPDPELLLNRVDWLSAYSMIEEVFVAIDSDGQAAYTHLGQRHLEQCRAYAALIGRLSNPLHDDCAHFRPVDGAYSPYGAVYGTPSNLIEDIALKTLQRDAVAELGLEDVFTEGGAEKLAWVNGWRQLPHIDSDVQKEYAYPEPFAEYMFDRVEQAFARRASGGDADSAAQTGRLVIVPADTRETDPDVSSIPELPVRYVVSSDEQIVAAGRADAYDQAQLLHGRREGYFVVSYQTSGGWVAIKKDLITEVLGAGRDTRIAGLPAAAARVLTLMCPGLDVESLTRDRAGFVRREIVNERSHFGRLDDAAERNL